VNNEQNAASQGAGESTHAEEASSAKQARRGGRNNRRKSKSGQQAGADEGKRAQEGRSGNHGKNAKGGNGQNKGGQNGNGQNKGGQNGNGQNKNGKNGRGGTGRKGQGSMGGQGKVRKDAEGREYTTRRKHVSIEHQRPHLTRGQEELAPEEFDKARTRSTKTRAPKARPSVKRDPSAKLRVIPLGGLDGIGKNMTAFECGDDMIVVDAGLMFPDDNHPGIDMILPDYTYVLENEDKLKAILITHGHEDHTGALPYLMKDLSRKVPIYGTKLTLGLIEGKFNEHRVKARLCEVHAGDQIKLGQFVVDFFAVNHSIPGALGVFLQSPAGNVLHTGDFKLDQTPIDGVHFDFGALARYHEIGVDLMLADSTNAMKKTFTPSEAEVGKTLRPIIANAKGRVIIASFASHIHRLQQICDAAVACGRKVVVTGRSMVQNVDIARRLGYLNVQDENLIDAYDLKGLPPEKVVIMCTGSQGEPLSALARIAAGEHRTIEIDAGDTVIISATPVPGNEKAVTRIINLLAHIGCDVWDKSRAMVHVSGHAGAEELKIVLSIVQPKAFMPVHGEAAHLRAHAKLAEEVGIPEKNIFICDNGDTLTLDAKGVRRTAPVESGIVYVDGLSVGDTTADVLDERNQLSSDGIASIAAAVDLAHRKVAGHVHIEMKGITGGDLAQLREEARETVEGALRRALEKGKRGRDLEKVCKDALQSLLWERTKQRPLVITSLIEV
jgi:ribonuclease J